MSEHPNQPSHDSVDDVMEMATLPVVAQGLTAASVTDKISSIVLTRRTPPGWFVAIAITFSLVAVLGAAISYLLLKGVGIWGVNIPIGWGFAIVNFVWWI